MDSNIFYGFGDRSDFYISFDGGQIFRQRELPSEAHFPEVEFSLIDCANKTEVRGKPENRAYSIWH